MTRMLSILSSKASTAPVCRFTLWIDTDGGLDDYVAISMLARSPQIRIGCITAVGGMSDVPSNTIATAKRIIAENDPYLDSSDIEFGANNGGACSALEPAADWLTEQRETLASLATSLSPQQSSQIPSATESAVRFLSELLEKGQQCQLLALGPLTNVAALMTGQHKDLFQATVKDIVVMGGALEKTEGNYDGAEFNFRGDPAAVATVLNCGRGNITTTTTTTTTTTSVDTSSASASTQVTLVPLDVCEERGWELCFEEAKRSTEARQWMAELVRRATSVLASAHLSSYTEELGTLGSDSRTLPAIAAECIAKDRAGMGCVIFDPVAAHFVLSPGDFETVTYPAGSLEVTNRGALIIKSRATETATENCITENSFATSTRKEIHVAMRFPGRRSYMEALTTFFETGIYNPS